MAVIYLKHPKHGQKVASSEVEAADDRKNGWLDFNPSSPDAEPEQVADSELEKVKADLKEAKADLKAAKAALKKAGVEFVAPSAAPVIPPFLVDPNKKPEG